MCIIANKTITGCYNSSTKAITFADESCAVGDYTGCYVASGANAGMIAVTFTETNCPEDTYYGCFDSATGNFELEIPDDCCPTCDDVVSLQVLFVDVNVCSDCQLFFYNMKCGRYSFTLNPLGYTLTFDNVEKTSASYTKADFAALHVSNASPCDCGITTDYYGFRINATKNGNQIHLQASLTVSGAVTDDIFVATGTAESGCWTLDNLQNTIVSPCVYDPDGKLHPAVDGYAGIQESY